MRGKIYIFRFSISFGKSVLCARSCSAYDSGKPVANPFQRGHWGVILLVRLPVKRFGCCVERATFLWNRLIADDPKGIGIATMITSKLLGNILRQMD